MVRRRRRHRRSWQRLDRGGAGDTDPGSAWTEGKESEDPSTLVSPEDYAVIQGAIQNALVIHGPGAGQPVLLAAAIAAAPVAIPVAIVVAVALAIIAILVAVTDPGPPPVAELGQAAVAQAAIRAALAAAAGITTAAMTQEDVKKFQDRVAEVDAAIKIVVAANVAAAQKCFKELLRFNSALEPVMDFTAHLGRQKRAST